MDFDKVRKAIFTSFIKYISKFFYTFDLQLFTKQDYIRTQNAAIILYHLIYVLTVFRIIVLMYLDNCEKKIES